MILIVIMKNIVNFIEEVLLKQYEMNYLWRELFFIIKNAKNIVLI